MRARLRGPTACAGATGPYSEPARPGLDLDEDQRRAVQGDQVELAGAGAGVALDHAPSLSGQAAGRRGPRRRGPGAVGRRSPAPALRVAGATAGCADRVGSGTTSARSRAPGASRARLAFAACSPWPAPSPWSAIEAEPVHVELDVAPGLPGFAIVGLPDAAVRESRERVRSALLNCGLRLPDEADHREPGAGRCCARRVPDSTSRSRRRCWSRPTRSRRGVLERYALAGELALDGSIRPVPGRAGDGRGCAIAGAARDRRGARGRAAGGAGRGTRGGRARPRRAACPRSPTARSEPVPAPDRSALDPRSRPRGADLADLKGQPSAAASPGDRGRGRAQPAADRAAGCRQDPGGPAAALAAAAARAAEALEVIRIAGACGRGAVTDAGGAALPGAAPHGLRRTRWSAAARRRGRAR